MSSNPFIQSIAGTCISMSYILVGNAITQSFMTVPALLVDFPPAKSPAHAARAQLLGRQWPLCWTVGNQFFRPISMLGFLGYGAIAMYLYRQSSTLAARGNAAQADWRVYAVSALCHLATIVHSARNMQPLNDKLEALAGRAGAQEMEEAEGVARRWASWNRVRILSPLVAGSLALWQSFFL
ncbi:uncharacterized protein BDZ99DRAFT_479646 [Mytilinidion resinicola]|uniref:DUF1772-domain-containing protein n=1 Tax=Mytilinidion resinicola TaxID=574789 RepID=A0A6A6YCU4_9PEZI|nr:uncharacterized protein BDZ99DRAFT_479646 [Mytilinidion resinicola]KAF2806388.1 hypothetical protein BDZ99DRAFT_479646 [Mytilinidion resinicola]